MTKPADSDAPGGHTEPMQPRFIIRPDPVGFSVVDLATGEAARVAQAPQSHLSLADAEHMAGLLNAQAPHDDRRAVS